MDGRYAKVTIACGRRLTGKTNETLTQLYKAVHNGRKALIFDATDEFGSYIYREGDPPHSIRAIYLKDIPRFTVQKIPEIRRIRPIWDNGDRMSIDDLQAALAHILRTYRDGILLVEDINKYIADNVPNDVVGSLATVRQAGIDLIAHYQFIGKAANPKILGMANYIRMHKTNDEVSRYEDRFLGWTDRLSVAENIVNRRYDWGMENKIYSDKGMFFSCIVDLEYGKIRGIFTQKEAELAIEKYLAENSNRTIKKLLNSKTRTGAPMYTDYEQAYSKLESSMMKDFFDFKRA